MPANQRPAGQPAMNIAHLLPYSATFPLNRHNGRYEWVLRLARLQATAGNQVTIYSSPQSQINIPGIFWKSVTTLPSDRMFNNQTLLKAALANQTIDIFHSHFDYLHYSVASLTTKPIVFTQHWFPGSEVARAAQQANYPPNVLAVPVTNIMAAADKRLGIPAGATIYHGIDLELFSFSARPRSDRLLFAGRIAAAKGIRQAIDLAKQTSSKLDIIGKVNAVDKPFWQTLAPLIDGSQIQYLGPKSSSDVASYMQRAKALLFPNQRIEAFGQTIIEAQACGTPVIASDNGGSAELIEQGVTGFLAKDLVEFKAAIEKVSGLNPADCRRKAAKFDSTSMSRHYEELYRQLTNA